MATATGPPFTHAYQVTCVIEGEARGADLYAAEAARFHTSRALPRLVEQARACSRPHSQPMLDEGNPDAVWAFHTDIAQQPTW